MTEKRFTSKLAEIFDNSLAYGLSKENPEDVIKLLDRQYEEIQKLDEWLTEKSMDYNRLSLEYEELVAENKELKKQMNRLYNYFWDWHSDEMGGNQFSEMWDGVKESEKWDEEW